MLGQIIHRLRHLFEIEHLGPAFVTDALSGAEVCLNIHQQIDLFFRHGPDDFLTRFVSFFAGEDGPKLRFTVAAAQRIQPNKPLLIFPAQGKDFSRFDFISGVPQELQERVKIGGLLG